MSISKSLVMLNSIDREDLTNLEQHPNVGPAIADDLRRIGLKRPQELTGQDPYALFDALCRETGARHDPCVIDVFIAAVRFMDGGDAQPWWAFTAERKKFLASRNRVWVF